MEVGGWRGWRGCQLAGAEAGVQDQGKLGIGVPFNSCYHQLSINPTSVTSRHLATPSSGNWHLLCIKN